MNKPPQAPQAQEMVKHVGVGAAATDQLSDALTQLATVSTYLSAASAGNATATQLQAAQTALVTAQTDILNASAAVANGTAMPAGTWVKGPAAIAVALGTGLIGGAAGYYVGKKRKKE